MLQVILFVLYAVLLGMFGLAVWRLRYGFRHFKMNSLVTVAKTIEAMPSVTVCIPARNEDHAMSDALERVTATTYPKLEVIVLDDRSADNTSALIKAFAHEGVRFVEGKKVPEGWLGKNHALQELLAQASGTYILFMDVDTRLTPDSIEQLVAYAMQEQAKMVSVLPRREDSPRASVFFSTLRYFWEIMFHRKSSPATASNAWLIHRQTLLERLGGFESIKDAVQPESRISSQLMASGEYRFLIGTEVMGISFEKKWRSQLSTSVRLLFPLLQLKTPNSIIAALDLLVLSTPLWILLSGFIVGWNANHLIAGVFILLFAGLYGAYLQKVWNRGWIIGGLLWSVITLQEAVLIIVSSIRYRQKLVTWKGRLVSSAK
ncbi:glycosyltransferase [Candidatus Saccharibacteria bacterium]|nr:glycosyltransferase [Candidatus Saccharibacteria bacterium]